MTLLPSEPGEVVSRGRPFDPKLLELAVTLGVVWEHIVRSPLLVQQAPVRGTLLQDRRSDGNDNGASISDCKLCKVKLNNRLALPTNPSVDSTTLFPFPSQGLSLINFLYHK